MKSSIVSATVIAGAICMNVCTNANAQDAGNDKLVTPVEAAGQTILTGNWSIALDATGKLIINDRDNNVVKVVDSKGIIDPIKKCVVFNSPFTFPLTLNVDKQGNLHLIDNTEILAGNALPIVAFPLPSNGFEDPDRQPLQIEQKQIASVTSQRKK